MTTATMTAPARMRADRRREQAKKMHAEIVEQVERLGNTEEWKKFLDYVQQFHNYSAHNVFLIMSQRRGATQVAGYQKWQKLGRQVKKGERAIKIFGFSYRNVEVENPKTGEKETERRAYYPMLNVFDVSQTEPIEGYAPPENPLQAEEIRGDDPSGIFGKCEAYMAECGWSVEKIDMPEGEQANGWALVDGTKKIQISAALDPAGAAKTLIHEAAHALMHADEDGKLDKNSVDSEAPRSVMEIEAESVAYIVSGLLGLNTADYSFRYVAGWAGCNSKKVIDSASRIVDTAHKLISAIDPDEKG